jgi:Ca2+/H+ antiporter
MCALLAIVKCVNYLCLCAYCVNLLLALDSNNVEFSEEGEVFEYQEEDQGQADQGKPSKLVAYLILVLLTACFINVYKNAYFYIAITSR